MSLGARLSSDESSPDDIPGLVRSAAGSGLAHDAATTGTSPLGAARCCWTRRCCPSEGMPKRIHPSMPRTVSSAADGSCAGSRTIWASSTCRFVNARTLSRIRVGTVSATAAPCTTPRRRGGASSRLVAPRERASALAPPLEMEVRGVYADDTPLCGTGPTLWLSCPKAGVVVKLINRKKTKTVKHTGWIGCGPLPREYVLEREMGRSRGRDGTI